MRISTCSTRIPAYDHFLYNISTADVLIISITLGKIEISESGGVLFKLVSNLAKLFRKLAIYEDFDTGFHLYLVHISRSSSELKSLCRVFSSRRILQNS